MGLLKDLLQGNLDKEPSWPFPHGRDARASVDQISTISTSGNRSNCSASLHISAAPGAKSADYRFDYVVTLSDDQKNIYVEAAIATMTKLK